MTRPIGMMVTKNSSPSTSGFITLYSRSPNFSHSRLSGAENARINQRHQQERCRQPAACSAMS